MSTDPRTVEGYNKGAEAYNAHVSSAEESPFHAFYEKPAIRTELPDLRGLSVISIGCGSGVDTAYLKQKGAEKVVGVDISSGLIDIAKKNHEGIDFRVMDMEKLDFPQESFDLAYSSLALHYLDSWTLALREARRVLKPNGLYVFSCGHPIESAMEIFEEEKTRGTRLGKTIVKESGARIMHGDYLAASENGVKQMSGKIGEIEVHFFHRPISKMIADIVASGFKIEKMIEPLPTEGMKEKYERHYNQLMRFPDFMIWVLRK